MSFQPSTTTVKMMAHIYLTLCIDNVIPKTLCVFRRLCE